MTIDQVSAELRPPYGTERLCRNLVETTFGRLSDDNVRIFKDRLLDMTGCIFGGDLVKEDRFFYDLLKRWGGSPEAPLFADSSRLPAVSAAMHNALHARANDFGNMQYVIGKENIPSHFGETLMPLGLTLADMFHASGEDFITYHIAAEDMVGRILYSLPVRWPTDMQLGSTAAAALASRYYGLDAGQTKTALSFAATNATDPANAYFDYSQEFKLHNAESARMGILAAEAAKGGWQGLADPYYGHWGLISKQVGNDGELPALYENSFKDLGQNYYTEQRFKMFPGGIPTTAVAKCGQLLNKMITESDGKVDPESIGRVRVFRSKVMRPNYYDNPFSLRNHINALFSYRFSACCALLNGTVRVDQVQTEAILRNPALIRLAESATMEEFDSSPTGFKVVAEMNDGKEYEASCDFVAAMNEYPSKEILQGKFWDQFNAFGKLPRSVGEKIIELADKIETVSDMREYTELLVVKKP